MEFVMPERLIREEFREEKDYYYGKYVLSPLERGYSITIGNTLRRILLSSIPSLAITAIKIPGKLHEFDVIEGVKEDILEITINLKKVQLRYKNMDSIEEVKGPIRLEIRKKGPGILTAGDILLPAEVEVSNPDFVIAHINKDVELEMELFAEVGRGYIPVSEMDIMSKDIELIYIDGVFSPVLKVNYITENVRVGRRTDYDKLILEVWTKKNITPDEALKKAVKIAIDHFMIIFKTWGEIEERVVKKIEEKGEEVIEIQPPTEEYGEPEFEIPGIDPEVLMRKIDELDLSKRAKNCLKREKILTVGELLKRTPEELMKIKNFGKKSLDEIRKELKEKFEIDYDKLFEGRNE